MEKPRRLYRRLLIGILLILAITIGLMITTAMVLQSNWGRERVVSSLKSTLNSPGTTRIMIGQVSGNLLERFSVDRIVAADRHGDWLDLHRINVEWSPWALLKGIIDITSIEAKILSITRQPSIDPESKSDTNITELSLAKRLRIRRFSLTQIDLGQSVLGQPAQLTVNWRQTTGTDATESINLQITDRTAESFRLLLDAQYQPQFQRLSAKLDFHELAGGLIANLIGLKQPIPLSLQATGSGTGGNWSGQLNALQGSEKLAQMDYNIIRQTHWKAFVSGEINPSPLLQPSFPTVLNDPIKLGTRLSVKDDQLEISDLTIENPLASASIAGTVSADKLDLIVRTILKPGGVDALKNSFGRFQIGQSDLTAKINGTPDQPEILLSLALLNPSFDKINAQRLKGEAKIQIDQSDKTSSTAIEIESSGKLTGIRLDQTQSNSPTIEFTDWMLNAKYAEDDALIQLKQAVVSTPFGRILGDGEISLDDQPRDIQINADIPQLSPLSPFFQQPLSGSASLVSSLTLRNGLETIRGTIDGQVHGLSLENPKIDPLVGPKLTLHTNINKAGEHIEIDRITINSPALSVTGDYQIALQTGVMRGGYRVSAPHLAAFSKLLATPIRGRLSANGEVGGTTEQANLLGQIDVSNLLVDQTDFGALTIRFKTDELPRQPTGSIDFGFDGGKFSQTIGSTDFDLDQRQSINLHNLVLESRASNISGDINLPRNGQPITGELTAQIPSLAEWSALLGYTVSGSTRAKINLSANNQTQRAQVTLDVANISIDDSMTVNQARLECTVDSPQANPTGRAKLVIDGAQIGGAQISRFSAEAKSNRPAEFRFNANAQGNLNGPLSIDLSGNLQQQPKRISLNLAKLTGRLADQSIQLTKNLAIVKSKNQLAINNLALSVGKGSITGNAQISDNQHDISLAIDRLPLSLSKLIWPQYDIKGTLTGTSRILGSRKAPQAEIELRAKNVNLKNTQFSKLQNHWLNIRGRLRDNQFKLDGQLGGFGNDAAELVLNLPIRVKSDSWLIEIAPHQALDGSLFWHGQLAPIWAFISPEEDQFDGLGELSLSLAGTTQEPVMTGHINLNDARYANIETGTTISNIVLRIDADKYRLMVRELTASDGATGKINGGGDLELDPDSGYPVNLQLGFSNTKLVATDEMQIDAGGQLTVTGKVTNPLLSGAIVTQNIQLNLDHSAQAKIVELPVEEINVPGAPTPHKRQTNQRERSGTQLDLAISIPGKAFVRGLGLDSEWRGDIKITGDANAPKVQGILEPVRGFFAVWGRNFDLKRGAIRFAGTKKIDPLLNLTAEYKSTGITAVVTISGSASNPKIELSSRPVMPQSEIASRVLFGTDANSLSPAQSIQLASAVSSLSGLGGTSNFIDATRRILGIDVLKFDESDIDSDKTRISMGKYVADGVYVELQQGTDGDSQTSATVEFEILPNISIEGGTTERGGNKVGLKWRWDY